MRFVASRWSLPIALVLVFPPTQSAFAQTDQEDIIEILLARPGMAEQLGIAKLTAEELEAWNEVLNAVLTAGGQLSTPASSPGATGIAVFEATVEARDGPVIQLSDGAVIEVSGYLGNVSPPGRSLLVRQGRSWRLWIEGTEAFTVRMLGEPDRGGRAGELVSVGEILGDGAILHLTDGRTLEVDAVDRVDSAAWLPFFNAVLVGGYELFNLDRGEKVSVRVIGQR